MTASSTIQDLFRRMLTPLWLRPERALCDAHIYHAFLDFLGGHFEPPSLEYGCADGIMSFLMLGGECSSDFDDYLDLHASRNSYREQQMLESDYFDQPAANFPMDAIIRQRPKNHFTVGISWKKSHIEKARRLNFYDQLHHLPFNEKLALLPSNSQRTIFAPNLFWMNDDELKNSLTEMRRVCSDQGRLITAFPNPQQKEFLFYDQFKNVSSQWADDLDRGMHLNLTRQMRWLSEWRVFLAQYGWAIKQHREIIPALVSQVYQIGLRPMFPVFLNMYHRLRNESIDEWLDLKTHWIETALHFLRPLCDAAWLDRMNQKKLWYIFELYPE